MGKNLSTRIRDFAEAPEAFVDPADCTVMQDWMVEATKLEARSATARRDALEEAAQIVERLSEGEPAPQPIWGEIAAAIRAKIGEE